MRWNACWKLGIATGETVLYSGMDEGENHERGVGFLKKLRNVCWNGNQCLRG